MIALHAPLVRIEGTWFMMGSEDGADNERPIHRVWLDTFELGAWQVTHGQYASLLESTGHAPPPFWNDSKFNDPNQPVVAVSWFDAVSYCDWLSGATGRHFRLPTEAEWECAARGGSERRLYPWGDDSPQSRPDYNTRWRAGPEPVARGAPTAAGLYDICENVHEWCSDWYGADYYGVSPERNPGGPATGSRRVSRGGSWRHQIKISRCAARSSIPPEFQYADYGFRVACDSV
jgi:formylglycine-generating enzyme required for sulfatase activity